MAKPESARELDALVAVARRSQAPALDALSARRMVRKALAQREHAPPDAAADARRSPGLRHGALWAAAALLACLGAYALSRLEPGTHIAVSAHGLPLRLSLATGDNLVLAPASELQVLSEEPALRRVRLSQGSALFDVVKRDKAQRFEVKTPHASVRVRGTVFTVQVDDAQSFVRVHEGSVWVNERVLHAGEAWASPGRRPPSAFAPPRALEPDIRTALAARSAQLREPVARASRAPQLDAIEPNAAAPAPALQATPTSDTRSLAELRSTGPSLEQLRALLRLGQGEQVIAQVRARATRDDALLLLLADALRAQGHLSEAADHYERLAERGRDPLRAQAGFAAAQIALVSLRDAQRALRDIERFQLDADDCPLSERASALHAEALLAEGRRAEARAIAEHYLARQPETEASAGMRRILQAPDAP